MTAILYANPSWVPGHGGKLRLWPPRRLDVTNPSLNSSRTAAAAPPQSSGNTADGDAPAQPSTAVPDGADGQSPARRGDPALGIGGSGEGSSGLAPWMTAADGAPAADNGVPTAPARSGESSRIGSGAGLAPPLQHLAPNGASERPSSSSNGSHTATGSADEILGHRTHTPASVPNSASAASSGAAAAPHPNGAGHGLMGTSGVSAAAATAAWGAGNAGSVRFYGADANGDAGSHAGGAGSVRFFGGADANGDAGSHCGEPGERPLCCCRASWSIMLSRQEL